MSLPNMDDVNLSLSSTWSLPHTLHLLWCSSVTQCSCIWSALMEGSMRKQAAFTALTHKLFSMWVLCQRTHRTHLSHDRQKKKKTHLTAIQNKPAKINNWHHAHPALTHSRDQLYNSFNLIQLTVNNWCGKVKLQHSRFTKLGTISREDYSVTPENTTTNEVCMNHRLSNLSCKYPDKEISLVMVAVWQLRLQLS